MNILVWTDRINGVFTDHWAAIEDDDTAQREYESILDDEFMYSASLCKAIRSTDYEVKE